jgi:hypothetical protein
MTSNDENADSAPTSAGAGATDETTNIPAAAEATPDLALSLDDGDVADQPGGRHSWGSVWTWGAVSVLAGALIAVAIAAVFMGAGGQQRAGSEQRAAPAPVAPSPRPSLQSWWLPGAAPGAPGGPGGPPASGPGSLIVIGAPPTTLPPPPTTVTVEAPPPPAVPVLDAHDQAFLAALRRDQINIYDESKVMLSAHWICSQLAAGISHDDVAAEIRGTGAYTPLGAFALIYDSAGFYCPQYQ